MYTSSLLVAVAAFAGLATAQNLDGAVFNGQNYSVSGPIAVPPQNLNIRDKRLICTAQTQQCPQICGGLATNNTCDDNTLAWNCTCSNGNQPNISDYQQTVPGQVCRIWVGNCVNAHPDDSVGQGGPGQGGCRSVQCGNRTVTRGSTTSSSTSSSATGGSTAAPSPTDAGSNTATTTTSSMRGAATVLAVAQQYGNIAIAGGMAALLGLAL